MLDFIVARPLRQGKPNQFLGGTMPLIIGMNIRPDDGVNWRVALDNDIATFVSDYCKIPTGWVSTHFPHDPSVAPNAMATFIVDLAFTTTIPQEKQHDFAEKLGERLEELVSAVRQNYYDDPRSKLKPARVEVAVKPFDHKKHGFYMTPASEEPKEVS